MCFLLFTVCSNNNICMFYRNNESFLTDFNNILRQKHNTDTESYQFYLELPPLTIFNFDDPSELVLSGITLTTRTAQPPNNVTYYCSNNTEEEAFLIRKNSEPSTSLISPCIPQDTENHEYHVHLAKFMRFGNETVVRAFWKKVAKEVSAQISTSPIWVSTQENYINWLYVRIDQEKPNHYRFDEYRNANVHQGNPAFLQSRF